MSHMSPLGITSKRIRSTMKLSSNMVYERAKHKNSVSADTLKHVEQFYTIDDNSRMTSGKKQTLTRKKVKMHKRFLLDTVVNLYEQCKSEYPLAKILYSMFAKLRPFWVVKPVPNDRETRLFQIHENGQHLADRVYFLGLVTSKCRNVEDLAASVCCDINSRACAYGECGMCKERAQCEK